MPLADLHSHSHRRLHRCSNRSWELTPDGLRARVCLGARCVKSTRLRESPAKSKNTSCPSKTQVLSVGLEIPERSWCRACCSSQVQPLVGPWLNQRVCKSA